MFVKNPRTGRLIKVDSSTYKLLKSQGVNVSRLKKYSKKPTTLNKNSKKRIKSNKQRSSTRGWKKASPKRGKQRMMMKKKCGTKCFLKPSTMGYPVCNKSCKYDCRGIQSAINRAKQYHENKIADKAMRLKSKHC